VFNSIGISETLPTANSQLSSTSVSFAKGSSS